MLNPLHCLDQAKHRHPIDHLGNLNGFISGITLYPQLFHAINSQSLEDLSLITFSLIFLNSAIWVLYAKHRKLPALLVSSALNSLSSLGIAILILFQ